MKKPELKVSILTDYICPFCYIGNRRLDTLRDHYDLKVNWCFIEIHPETPASGHSTRLLNYSDETWDSMMKNLHQLADQEDITLCEQTLTTNSRKALLLSEACKSLGADVFYPLHEHIFDAYFLEGLNIGDESVLRQIANQHNITESLINQAWSNSYADGPPDSVPPALLPYLQYAGYLKAQSVPTIVIGDQCHSGVLSRNKLLELASASSQSD